MFESLKERKRRRAVRKEIDRLLDYYRQESLEAVHQLESDLSERADREIIKLDLEALDNIDKRIEDLLNELKT